MHLTSADKNTKFGEIRLLGGTAPNEGRVEMFYDHFRTWSTVCDDGWDDKNAVVVCRQPGFNTGGTAVGHATFGEGTGEIYRSGIDCTGEEEKLSVCRNAEYRRTSKGDHTQDSGERCNGT
ncbi:Scavenger receptor cysteine-rich domain superfamily protein [Holothuria leucospilota]|uniref:Scavenger receptor cysteine-rich domain superfamily protein n=1 Tax=Holothuria leucospilota TaxID=206669 RepID=A0A9Q1CL89_HOLLE|nr:Scavenger receptor cysteine-rich domain superfamily protein [Holothuria leucospilota]